MGFFQARSSSAVVVVTMLLLLLACCQASSSSSLQQNRIHARKMLNASASSPATTGGGGGVNSSRRVDVSGCSEPESLVTVYQHSDKSLGNGMQAYTVQIINNCTDCSVCDDVHLSCGYFANTELVDPAKFRRLSFDDCLVNDGGPLLPFDMISFQYANSFLYEMKVASADCNCG